MFSFPCSADHDERDWPPCKKVFFFGLATNTLCSVDLCFCTSDDSIDGSGRCFLEYEDSLHTTRRIILTGWEGMGRETDKRGGGVEPPAGQDKT